VLCVAYALDDGPVEIWTPGEPVPELVLAAAANPSCRWVAHNSAFERAILKAILVSRHGWPAVPRARHVCTMALSLAHGYLGSLDSVATMLGLVNQKDVAAAKEVAKMWKPRKVKRGEDPNILHWVDSPELRVKLHAYCKQDVATTRELHGRLPALTESEQEVWVIDAEINDRGVLIDAPLAKAASRLVVKALDELDARICAETGGAVAQASKLPTLKKWLKTQGVELPRKLRKRKADDEMVERDCLDADDIEKLLAGSLPNECVRKVLEVRLLAAQSAVSKVDRMLVTRCADGRVRNNYKMYGALTGRFAGEGLQLQNLKRPELLKTDDAVAAAIEMVRAENYEAIKAKHGDVLGVIGDLCRSMIIPAPGHRFIVGDFSAIEARVLTWLAGDTNKLETFRQFDAGVGPDIYCLAAENVLGLEPGTGKQERAMGKIFELGLGYGMGAKKILGNIHKSGRPNASVEDAQRWVDAWRRQNPKIVAFWKALEDAAIAALRYPGMPIRCGAISFEMRDGVLSVRLPSGRELNYPNPVIEIGRFGSPQITFPDRPRDKRMYGGKWAENVTSVAARDLLVDAMKRLRAAGYVLTLHTHDEIGAEVPVDVGSAEEFERILIEVPEWASGLPIAAKVFTCDRFKKD
jgi:DNA polymerase